MCVGRTRPKPVAKATILVAEGRIELAESARLEVSSCPDPLGWLAAELGVVDKRSVWQWMHYLFIFPPGRAARTESSSWNIFPALLVRTIGLLFSIVVISVLAGVRALSWFLQRLLSFLPAVDHKAVGRRLEGWLATPFASLCYSGCWF